MTTAIRPLQPIYFILLVLLFSACTSSDQAGKTEDQSAPSDGPPLFSLLAPSQTGISFQNTLTEGLNTNILMYEYFYNGGGVAVGDLNNDGLEDLYFTSNMEQNVLYLNKGEWTFEDITSASGAGGRPGPWKTGVNMADINGDGKLDIYVCYSGALPPQKRANQLFINQGNDENGIPQFKDESEAYGLASPAFSNQIYFFDFDKDQDLDALLLNHNPKSLPILNEANTALFLQQDDAEKGIRLLKNNGGKFTDITQQAGVSGSGLSYGLGLGISDLNNDGWDDFYVSNDYAVPDYLYLNNKDGTFTNVLNESIGHNSQFSMGNDIADVNNDGLQDILTLDMLPEDNHRQKLLQGPDNYAKFDLFVRCGFHYQYMRNMLQLNNGDGTYSEIGQLAGISNTDWSWSALLADYDNDGWKDLYITNGYFRDYTNMDFINYMDNYVKSKGRLQREDVLEIINHMPSSEVSNYMFGNDQTGKFRNMTASWGLKRASNSNGAAYADLDNDGDLDLIVNNINQPAFVYKNESQEQKASSYLQLQLVGEGKNTAGIGANISLSYGGQTQTFTQSPARGYVSSVSPIIHAGLGNSQIVDSLHIRWPNGKEQLLTDVLTNQRLTLKETEATKGSGRTPKADTYFTQASPAIPHQNQTAYLRDFDRQPLLLKEASFDGPVMEAVDLNQDGLEDIIMGGDAGQATSIWQQQKDGSFQQLPIPAFEADRASSDSDIAILDANKDGHLDLYVASGGYHSFRADHSALQDRLYLGDGNRGYTKSTLPPFPICTGAVAVADVNGDGNEDIFVGADGVPGRYPEHPNSVLLINDGQGNFTDQIGSFSKDLQEAGLVTDAVFTDLNQDGKAELIIVGEWMPISIFSLENKQMIKVTERYIDKSYSGLWTSIIVADLNNDNRPDLLVGNMGTNHQLSASDTTPLELFYDDFDENGSVDPLVSYYVQGESYPDITRDELLRQLAGLRATFTSYESYADVSLSEAIGKNRLKKAEHLTINHLSTSLFLSQEDGMLSPAKLPEEIQYAPIHTLNVLDVNQDGKKDLLLCGNDSHTKLRMGKMDANYGILLLGDGAGGFTYVPQSQSGLQVKGDVRSALFLDNRLILGMNAGPTLTYKLNSQLLSTL